MNKDNVSNIIISNTFKFDIKILKINKDIPDNEYDNFIEWIKFIPIKSGVGIYVDYYCYTNDYNDDIEVTLQININ